MNKGHSLQWKLTLITAFMVIASCLCTSYFVSKSAMLFFVEIEESAITMFPKENSVKDAYADIQVALDRISPKWFAARRQKEQKAA